jgi:energy-coupling factor transporter ATP-binding protein EcfA2
MKPDVLLLDEPTTGLDPYAYARLCDILLSLPQAMAIAAHDTEFVARLATRAIQIRNGVSYQGTVHAHPHMHVHAHVHFDEEHRHVSHHADGPADDSAAITALAEAGMYKATLRAPPDP